MVISMLGNVYIIVLLIGLPITKHKLVYIPVLCNGNSLAPLPIINACHYAKIINLQINYIQPVLVLAELVAITTISKIMKLRDVYKDVLQLNHSIMKISHRTVV